MQICELLYEKTPNVAFDEIVKRVEAILGEDVDVPDESDESCLLIRHKNHEVAGENEQTPQTALMPMDSGVDPANYADVIRQSWSCYNAPELLKQATCTMLISELMTEALSPDKRLALFHAVVQAAVEHTDPLAIVFKHSRQILATSRYLESVSQPPIKRPGVLSTRFFSISNSEGEMVVDTLGLGAVGMKDFQCHFVALDQDDVARILFDTAVRSFEEGATIESGSSVEIGPGVSWFCNVEESLMPPKREVIDLNPGPGYAATRMKYVKTDD